MFSNRSKYVIAIGFSAVLLLMIGIVSQVMTRLSETTDMIGTVVSRQNDTANLTSVMYSSVRERSVILFRMVNESDPFIRDQDLLRFRRMAADYTRARESLEKRRLDRHERAFVNKQRLLTRKSAPIQERVIEFLLSDQPGAARTILLNEAIPAQNRVLQLLSELLSYEREQVAQALAKARDTYDRTLYMTTLLTLFAIAIGILIAFDVMRRTFRVEDALFAKTALGSIADAVVTTDSRGRVNYINEPAKRLTGFSGNDGERRFLPELLGTDILPGATDGESFVRALSEKLKHDSGNGESTIISDSQEQILVEYSISPIRSRDQQVIGAAVAFRDISERKLYEQELEKKEERFSLVMRGTNDGIWDFNLDSGQIYFSPRWKSMLGYEGSDFEGTFQNWQDHIHPDDLGAALIAWTDCMAGTRPSYSIEYRMRQKDGQWLWVECRGLALLSEDGTAMRLAGSHSNISRRKAAERALQEAKEHAEVTLHSIGDAVITLNDEGLVTFMNPTAEQLTGWTNDEAMGRTFEEIAHFVDEKSQQSVDNIVEACMIENKLVELEGHVQLVSRDGSQYAIEQSAAPIRGKSGQIAGVVTVIRDVSTERSLKNQLSWQASHDGLTGLANRREFERHLDELIDAVAAGSPSHALLYLDLDQFKIVNDTCGHVAGDELLRQLSGLLKDLIRSSDTLARLGGDEFGLLLESCPLDRAARIAQSLREAIREYRFAWENHVFDVGVSIGVVPIVQSSGSRNDILSAADVACYAAKDAGRNRVHVYLEDNDDLVSRHGEIRWVSRIREALSENRFVAYHQPIVPVSERSGAIPHSEILVRLLDQDGKVVPPGAFIPAAERYNLMPEIDRYMVRQVFSWLRDHQSDACYRKVSINLSGTSINDDDFLEFIRWQFEEFLVPPGDICFEITETAAIANLSKATRFIRELKSIGCLFALDDFGSGLSSFAYLKNLPVDFLKIDGQFVKDMVEDRMDFAMVKSINEIGHVMGMQTIAEFVENRDILSRLKYLGVDFAQGYGVAKPSPLDEESVQRAAG